VVLRGDIAENGSASWSIEYRVRLDDGDDGDFGDPAPEP
jgi:hypothetical protein